MVARVCGSAQCCTYASLFALFSQSAFQTPLKISAQLPATPAHTSSINSFLVGSLCIVPYREKFLGHYKNKAARKPCSVLDNHLSGIRITPNLKRFFRSRRTAFKPSIQSCILPGVAWPVFLNTAGDALTSPLHHRSYFIKAVSSIFSVVLSASSRCPEFLRRPVLGCTDFPHIFMRDYPAALLIEFYHKYFIK